MRGAGARWSIGTALGIVVAVASSADDGLSPGCSAGGGGGVLVRAPQAEASPIANTNSRRITGLLKNIVGALVVPEDQEEIETLIGIIGRKG